MTVPSLAREFGGPRGKALTLAGRLRGMGHAVEVIGCGSEAGATGLKVATRFHGTPVPATLAPLRRALADADVVHVLGLRDPVGTFAALEARRRHVPYLVEPAGMHRRRGRSLTLKLIVDAEIGKRVIGGAGAIVATSRMEVQELVTDGVDPDRIRLRPNGVELDGLRPLPERGRFRSRIGATPDVPLVLALGRITAGKGLLHLLQALVDLPGAWGVIAGPDAGDGTLAVLESARRRLGVEGRSRIISSGLWGREKAEALADADCFCLPSASENFGVAPAEAACLGIPVVVSDRCGVAEWLEPRGSRVVPYGDVARLQEAVRRVLQDSGVREAARASAARLCRCLDWGRLVLQQEEIYREIVAPPSLSP